jgi:Signal transduction histidine kinase
MISTLKGKISFVYTLLISTIILIGTFSIISIISLKTSVNEALSNNYKSINYVNDMIICSQKQNNTILTYIYSNPEKGINDYNSAQSEFNRLYNLESNNLTEKDEKNLLQKTYKDYNDYVNLFFQLQQLPDNKIINISMINFYNENINVCFNQLLYDLNNLLTVNETAMKEHTNYINELSNLSMILILIFSVVFSLGGYVLSKHFTNKALKPIYSLREVMKAVKDGDLTKQAIITTQDEIGELTQEFNKVTKRLYEFERSTMGQLLTEKNKSIAIVKSISDPLVVLDSDLKISLVNLAFESFFNADEGMTLNKSFEDVIKNADINNYLDNFNMNNFQSLNHKVIYINKNNKNYYFNISINIIKSSDVTVDEIIVLFKNVTEIKTLEKMKLDFISTISHEIKTPLTSILMGTSLIVDDNIGALNSSQKKIISAIKEDSENLSDLVINLLNLIKLQSRESLLQIEPASIVGVIQQSIKSFYEQAKNKDINLYFSGEEDLPKVNMDAEKIVWVLNNLISNALKFTNAGDTIEIAACIRDKRLIVTVQDSGIGIPEKYVQKVFDKFVQIDGENASKKGTGLGLALAKEIIETHHGEIWCESKLDLGSSFYFSLPV